MKAIPIPEAPNQRIEPMKGSAVSFGLYSAACGALPLMAHPRRWSWQ
jgi:hypothetical protein